MSKVKSAITFSSVFTKIIIGIAALALVACIVILITKCPKNAKKEYYDCQQYEWHYVNGTTPSVINQLEAYDYYRLYLKDDKTFEIKYMVKNDDKERSEGGTYVKSGNTYTLTYSGTPTQDLATTITFTVEDGKLIRSDRALAPTGVNYTIVQVFSK